MIGDSPIGVDTVGDITIKERVFKESKEFWELLTRKKVNTEFITKVDLKTYKKILTMTNLHLTRYQPDGKINITLGKIFRNVIAPLFTKPKGRSVESALRRKWTKYYWLILLAVYTMNPPDRPVSRLCRSVGRQWCVENVHHNLSALSGRGYRKRMPKS